MPSFLFEVNTPQPGGSPASFSSSRWGHVRTMLNGSSVYSNSPLSSNTNSPKLPLLGLFRRGERPEPITVPGNGQPNNPISSHSPLRPLPTASSYIRVLGRHPADLPLDRSGSVDPETEQLAAEVNRRRRRRRRRKHHHDHYHHQRSQQRHHSRQTHWVRRKSEPPICFSFIKGRTARSKCFACLISGFFLITVLTIYLTLALIKKPLRQEVHVLFILFILGGTIVFCHSLIRLCMLILRPEPGIPAHMRIPSVTGPEGFQPSVPIPVVLARDEELGLAGEADEDGGRSRDPEKDKERGIVKMPPPAYGLWRSSVRADPNLLHWRRVEVDNPDIDHQASPAETVIPSSHGSRGESGESQRKEGAPRPPSYVSEDGVEYVVSAARRSVARSVAGLSDVHPAWRPGFAVSEVGNWAASR